MQLKLHKFDITSITDDSVVVFIGKRRTGKSFLIKDLLYYFQDLPIGTVISATEKANKFYGDIVPSLFIHDDYNPTIVDNVLTRQKKVKKKYMKEKNSGIKPTIDPRTFLILDDLMYDDKWIRDKRVKECFFNGRHWNLMFMVTMQYPLGITPNLRTNIDYVFILRESNYENRQRLYKNYAGMFSSFELFCTVMDQCTENHECLVIKNNSTSNKLEEQVFWYKAKTHEPFQIGAKVFWDAHYENYKNDDDSDEEEQFNPESLKKKKMNVNVSKQY
jgi:hypothetical protein